MQGLISIVFKALHMIIIFLINKNDNILNSYLETTNRVGGYPLDE